MVTMTREGVILEQAPLTEEQCEEAFCMVFRAFLRAHPEELTGGQEATEASTSPA